MTFRHHIFFFLTLIIYLTVFTSCNSKHSRYSIAFENADSITAESLSKSRKKNFENIIKEISSNATVDCAKVGIAGIESEQYKRFLWLKEFASNNELIQLTKLDNGKIKVYAFWALTDRDYPNCNEIFKQHSKDTTSFEYLCGCLGNTKFLNLFYLSLLSNKLDKNQIALFKKEISKCFDKKNWELIERMDKF